MGQRESHGHHHARRVDPRWARVALAQLRDDEFLSRQLRRQETLAGARRVASRRPRGHAHGHAHGSSARGLFVDGDTHRLRDRALWTKLLKRREPPRDDGDDEMRVGDDDAAPGDGDAVAADALLHALVLLGDLAQPTRASYLLCHLEDQLARDCAVADPLADVVALRREILTDVYDAVAIQHQHFRASAAAFRATVELIQHATDEPGGNGQVGTACVSSTVEPSSSEASFVNEFTVELIAGLLEAVATSDGGGAAVPKRELFHEMIPLIESLAPLSLMPPRDARSPPSLNTHGRNLVEKLQRFLLAIATGKQPSTVGSGSPSRSPSTAQVEFDVADRTNAVNCLIRLAAANGSVRDFLVVVSVLLGLGDGSESSSGALGLLEYPIQTASSPRAVRLAHGSTSPVANTSRSPTREQFHLKEYDSDHVLDDERGDVDEEMANFAVEQRLKQVHKQRGDQASKDFDGQTTAVDQLLSSHSKRKTGPKSLVVAHTKATTSTVVVAGASPALSNLTTHRVSVPHPPSLASKLNTRVLKDDLNNLSLEADLTYSLDVTSSRSDIPSPPSPRHVTSSTASIVCPKFHPLPVGAILKEIDRIKPADATRPQSFPTLGGHNHQASDFLLHHETEGGDDDHEVWSCGQNSYGELGHGDSNSRKSFERIEALQQKDIVQVSAGNEHTVALSSDGTVWTCGYNDNGQCGLGVTTRINHLTEVQKLGDFPVTQVHAYNGCEHTILVTQDGRAASCGYNYRGQLGHGNTQSESIPKIMRSLEGKQVRLVSCSYYHTAITCDTGPGGRSLVYTFGRNDYGQLGHGDTMDRKVPQSVDSMHDQHIVSIACGQYHTMAVASSGKLFAFGKNDYGQLGVDTVENQLSPVHVKYGLERQTCMEVRCGYYHSIVLCSGAHLFGFGRNDYGQLGIGKSTNPPSVNMQLQQQRFARPQLVEDLEGKEIVRFACGCYHTVAVSDNGVLYVFGRNNHGQLGTGDTNERLYPHPIDDFIGKRVALVAAGFYHTLVLTGGRDDDVEEDQNNAALGSRDGVLDSEDPNRSELSALSSSAILSSPFVKELYEARVPCGEPPKPSKSTTTVSVQQGSSFSHDRDSRDPSSDADTDDGRTEDRYTVAAMDSEITAMSDRPGPRHSDGDQGVGHLPSGGQSNSVGDSLDVVVVVLAQLDRLSAPFLIKKGTSFPLIRQLPTSLSESMIKKKVHGDLSDHIDGVYEKYSIQVQGSTLNTLGFLIAHLNYRRVEGLNSSSISTNLSPRVQTSAGKTQAYLLGVCFRLLQANLVQTIKSGVGSLMIAYQLSGTEQVSSRTIIGELSSLRDAVRHIRSVLLGIITKPKPSHKTGGNGMAEAEHNSSSGVGRVVVDSIDSLMLGFDLFFPCSCARLALLVNLIGSKGEESACALCQAIELSRLRLLKPSHKRHLLMATLKRLAEDAAVIKLLTPDVPSQLPTKQGRMEPFQTLDKIVDVLLDHLNSHFIHSLGEIAATIVPREDEPPIAASTMRSDQPLNDSIVTLLSVIQKHVASLASSCDRWTRNITPDETLSLSSRISLIACSAMRVGATGVESKDEKTCGDFPMAWRGMLQLALRVLGQSNDTLAQVMSRNQPSPSSSSRAKGSRVDFYADSEFCEQLGQALDRSVVGRVLPSLIHCLLGFSHIPAFAVSLITPLLSVTKLLDEWNSTNQAVRCSADEELKSRLGKSLGLSATLTNSTKQRPGGTTSRHPSATPQSVVGSDAVVSRVTVSEALESPWSLILEKELTIVCAEMAMSITLGGPLVDLSFGDDKTNSHVDSSHVKWRRSPLFEGGISIDCIYSSVVSGSSFARTAPYSPVSLFRLSTIPTQQFHLTLPQRENYENDINNSVGDYLSKPNIGMLHYTQRSDIRAFIAAMAQMSESGHRELHATAARLCETLRARHTKHDPAYRMLLRQSQFQKPPQPESDPPRCQVTWSDNQLEEAFFAALLHHQSLEASALLVGVGRQRIESSDAVAVQQQSPPACLVKLWRVVAEFRRRFVAKRTVLKNSLAPTEAQGVLDKLLHTTRDRIHLLLLVEVGEEEEHRMSLLDGGFVAPWDPAYIFRACTKADASLNSRTRVRLHLNARYGDKLLPFLVAFPSSRWRRVRTLFHVVGRWKASVHSSNSIGSTQLTAAALEFVTADDVGDIHKLAYNLLIDPCRQLSSSTRGYELLWDLMSMSRVESVRTCLVQHICEAPTKLTAGQTATLCATSKGKAGFAFREMCRNAQNDFLTAVVQFMVEKLRDWISIASNAPDKQSVQRVLLVLMRCLSIIRVASDQYEFINDSGLVQLIAQISDGMADRSEADCDRSKVTRGSAGVADTHPDEHQVKMAAWTLIRQLVLQLGESSSVRRNNHTYAQIPIYPACPDVFAFLEKDAHRLLQRLKCSGSRHGSLLERARNAGGSTNNTIRRSFEIIVAPKRLSFLAKGMTFAYSSMTDPAAGILAMSPLVKPSEFSITTWIFAAPSQATHGQSAGEHTFAVPEEKQIVFVRGDERQIAPYVVLQRDIESKWQLEVGVAVHVSQPSSATPTRLVWERLNSKESVIPGRWTHVAIVLEGAKMRLYINGILDSQRSLSGPLACALSTGSVDVDFCFGRPTPITSRDASKPPETTDALASDSIRAAKAMAFLSTLVSATAPSKTPLATSPSNTKPSVRSFNGLLSHFRFHNRSLSPIHVRIVYDEKKPVKEDAVTVSTKTPDDTTRILQLQSLLRVMVESDEGREHLANPSWSVELWEMFMCTRDESTQLSCLRLLRSVLLSQIPQTVDGVMAQNQNLTMAAQRYQFVLHVLQIIGTCISCVRGHSDSTFSVPASLQKPQSDEGSHCDSSMELRNSTAVRLLHDSARGMISITLACELTGLLVELLASKANDAWSMEIWDVFREIMMTNLANTVETDPGGWYARTGCLYVLGGPARVLAPGGEVQLVGTSDRATIIAVDDPSSSTLPRPSSHEGTSETRRTTTVYLSVHKVNSSPSTLDQVPWYELVEEQSASFKHRLARGKLTQHPSQKTEHDEEGVDDVSFVRLHRDDVVTTTPPNPLLLGTNGSPISDVVIGLSEAVSTLAAEFCLDTLGSVSMFNQWLNSGLLIQALSRAASSCATAPYLLRDGLVMTRLLDISTIVDANGQFAPLDEVESKLWVVRARVYQVLHDLEEQGELEVDQWFQARRMKVTSENKDGGSESPKENPLSVDQLDHPQPVGAKLDLRLDLVVDDPANDEERSVDRRGSKSSNGSDTDICGSSNPVGVAGGDDAPDSAAEDDDDAAGRDGDGEEDDEDEDDDEDDAEEDEDDEEAAEHRQEFVDELMMMGFPEEWCVLALKQTENDIVSASAWIVDNLEYLSRLQTSLDKQRDQSTDKLVIEDEDDDEGEEETAPDDLECSVQTSGAHHHNRSPSRQGSGLRTHPHSPLRPDGTHHLINDKEMGRKIFGEMYFPFEDGGFNSTGKDHFFTTWRTESTKGAAPSVPANAAAENGEEGQQPVQATDKSEQADKVQQFAAKIDSLDLNELLDWLAELEQTFLIVSCRKVVSTLLLQHEHECERVDEVCRSPSFLTFLKLVLCRGQQFQVFESGVGSEDQPVDVEAILRACLLRMLRTGDQAFAQRLLDFALDQVEAAASIPAFEAVLWTQRELRRSDRVVSDEPALELAAWLFELVLGVLGSDEIPISAELAVTAINRLRSALRSTNLPVKFIAITTMSRALQQIRRLQRRAVEISLQTLLEDCRLDVESFLCAAQNRFMREQVQHRIIFSLYLQAYVEILHLLHQVSSTTELESLSNALPPPIPLSCLAASSPLQTDPNEAIVNHPMLSFDRVKCRSSLLQMSDDGLTATFSGNEMWKTVVASHSFATGVHEWQIRIDKSSSSYLFIGVANRKANMDSFLGADDQSWGFIGDKALYYQRNRLRVYGDNFGEGDVVGVHLNCELGTLAFSKNGAFLGVAFDNLLDEVFPAVAFYSRNQKVSIVRPDDSCTDSEVSPTSHSSLASDGRVEEAVVVCDMMDSIVAKSPLPPQLLRSAYEMTMGWCDGTGRHVVTRSGSTLWVDVTKAACERFGFAANEQVRSPRGNGRVLGVADGRLWIEVDGESGAWHIHPSRLRTMTLSVLRSSGEDAGKSVPSCVMSSEKTPTGRDSFAVNRADPDALTQAEFSSFAQDRMWSLQLDRAVLNIINCHCESTSTSPWNISPDEIVRLVRAKAHEIEVAVGAVFSFEGSDGGKRLERKLIARYGFLRYFNAYLSRVVGFFDLTWQYFAPTSGLLPCRLLSQCRGSVFTSIKNEFFTALLDKTSNSPKKSDDDYDYPDDLTQMLINRPKAATAKCHPGTTTSLMLSMFGQAFDELHFLSLRMLRMVYSHPMDDGQLRSFKVKFEGEGVDDYGGPYREFFSQFFAELQMMCSEDDMSDTSGEVAQRGSDPEKSSKLGTSFLPFLMPSPNWRNGVGSSRERFILNGGLLGSRRVGAARVVPSMPSIPAKRGWAENAEVKRQLHSEMCHFLGQMIGIALRTRVCIRLDLAASVWKQLVGEDHDKESALADLKETDFAAHSLLKTLMSLLEEFESPKSTPLRRVEIEEEVAAMDLTFTTYLSDGRLVELCENGSDTTVAMANVHRYLDLVLQARMDESKDVVNVIKQGIHSIIPVAALGMLTWEELEKRICGVAEVDVELLKRNTEYDEDLSAQDEFIQRFWRVLAAMDDEDKRAFLRFVWARSRLPVGTAQFHQKFKIQSLASTASGSDNNSNGNSSATASSATNGYADNQLPKSHTCFFALQLPRYSSDEICRKQLLYAIHNCVEMDGDFRLADAEMTGWTDVNPSDQLRF